MTLLSPYMRMPPWVWILALQLVLVAPFVFQPIHIDDSIYVDIARNALKNPWHPQDLPYIFEGRRVSDMGSHSHPPFVSYWIALFLRMFGEGPHLSVLLHVGFLIFPLLFAIGIYRLAVRFSASPPWVAVLAIVSPAAIVASHTLMTDYPCLAFSTLGMALYVEGVDERRPGKLWASGGLLAAAAFCSYPAVLLAAACWVYAMLKRSRMLGAFMAPLVAPAWMAAWLTFSSLHFGRFVLSATAGYVSRTGGVSATGLTHKLLAFPIFLAGTLVLPLPLIRATFRWLHRWAAIVWAVSSVGLAQWYTADYALRDRFLVALLLTVGGWIMLGLFLCMWRTCTSGSSRESRQDALFLTFWALIVSAQILSMYSSGMARYLLPLLPPMVLLAFFKSSDDGVFHLQRAAILGAFVGLVAALVFSVADFEMARVHRDIAQHLGKAFAGWESQTRFGAEWGLRHYMMEQHFRQILLTADDFTGGQFIVSPEQAVAYPLPQDVGAMLVPVRRESWQSFLPIRLMNRKAHAGFYSSAWGLLPFSFSRAPVEEITIQQVSFLAERLPEITLEAEPGEAILPLPHGDGVDIAIPAPSRITIPYNVNVPMRVQFSCVAPPALGECPIRIMYVHEGKESDVHMRPAGDSGESLYFELPGLTPSTLVLSTKTSETTPNLRRMVIRNWFMLPSGETRIPLLGQGGVRGGSVNILADLKGSIRKLNEPPLAPPLPRRGILASADFLCKALSGSAL